ncbi:hypothetical protein C2845_PM03G28080 [Panicum miliaceum]|uniref:DUF8039 domain-containing protein n=1 Tax=Panicum miliaceum TaxID=4540 RepID=A0A3L6TEL2_PANMI|nr:hypothetical protein C2845_PM03G28080 [Panicum miliaceum]
MSILASQGLQIVPISRNSNPVPGWRSSCASASAGRKNNDGPLSPLLNEEEDLDQMGVHHEDVDHDTISGLSEPTPCALIHAVGGYRVEVAWGQVYPRQFELHTVPIHEECAVVKVELVSDWPDIDLPFPPNDEIFKLGQAVLQRIQWRRRDIIVRPKQGSSQIVAKGITKSASDAAAPKAIVPSKEPATTAKTIEPTATDKGDHVSPPKEPADSAGKASAGKNVAANSSKPEKRKMAESSKKATGEGSEKQQ